MTWAEALAKLDTAVFGTFGETVTYNGTGITADVSIGDDLENGRDDGSLKQNGLIEVLKTDVATPAYMDPVIIDGVTWYVGSPPVKKDNITSWQLFITTDERPRLRR